MKTNKKCDPSLQYVKVKVTQLCLTLCDPMDYIVHGVQYSGLYSRSGPFSSAGDLPNPGIESRSPTLHVHSLPAEPQGTPKNTGEGSLSLLQWIFLTQELNRGLLHYRQILYQLSYEGSPMREAMREAFTAYKALMLGLNIYI